MYIQITTRCNMKCEHCCYSCTANGEDMTRETFIAACQLAEQYGEFISIGGGEPTIHAFFWDFIGIAQAYQEEEVVWLATNGKKADTALRLARLAERGVISVELSRDPYHEPIDERVVRAFTPTRDRGEYLSGHRQDYRGIRDVTSGGTKDPIPQGRAKEWASPELDNECVCDDLFVAPNGTLYPCGCQTRTIGTVFNPEIPEDDESTDLRCESGWHALR